MVLSKIDLAPLPNSETSRAVLATQLAAEIAQHGLPAVKASLLAGMTGVAADAPPSERVRLHRLYAGAYTNEELEGLIDNTLTSLGLGG